MTPTDDMVKRALATWWGLPGIQEVICKHIADDRSVDESFDRMKAVLAEAIAAQREADAILCEAAAREIERQPGWQDSGYLTGCRNEALSRAAAIRTQQDNKEA
jgi:hypothetical protein